jgi:pseudaminic acid biosynthesis-associated methylase
VSELWAGSFGDAYTERNATAGAGREHFWLELLDRYEIGNVLEVGCNVGANLRPIADRANASGIDVNESAIRSLNADRPDISAQVADGTSLPFPDAAFDLVFTMGVLIHVPTETLELVTGEIVRCSRRYVLAGEYFSSTPEVIPYRGEDRALFKRDFGAFYREHHPGLASVEQGFLPADTGFDDITWWLFEKQAPPRQPGRR